MKKCTKCKIEKPLTQFNKRNTSKCGFKPRCKDCAKQYNKQWHNENKEYRKQYCEENKKKRNEYQKQYRQNNKLELNNYRAQRKKENIQYKLAINLRGRLNIAVRNSHKTGSAVSDLGCSIDSFKQHIEKQFQFEMTWDNYGLYGWHLDHIIPLSFFDLTNRVQFLKACHYSNLQPLWAEDNFNKSDKMDWKK